MRNHLIIFLYNYTALFPKKPQKTPHELCVFVVVIITLIFGSAMKLQQNYP